MTTAPIPTAELERLAREDWSEEEAARLPALAAELIAARGVLQRYVDACLRQNIYLGGITGDAIALLPSAGHETE